jgi:hypothetical protein
MSELWLESAAAEVGIPARALVKTRRGSPTRKVAKR